MADDSGWSFEELYDGPTCHAIDAWRPSPGRRPPASGARGGVMAGALVVAGLAGVRDALDEDEPEIAEVQPVRDVESDEAVTVLFVPGAPHATIAVVRPWLLAAPGPAIVAVGRRGAGDSRWCWPAV
ncbi:MAG: hypothetical protein ACE5GB_12080 [Acidimicrobiales bacterium]